MNDQPNHADQTHTSLAGCDIRELAAPFGIEISRFDLSQSLSHDQESELRALLDKHQVIVFRALDLNADAQIQLLSVFGTVCDEFENGIRHSIVSNVDPPEMVPQTRQLPFHSDFMFTPWPLPVLSLYAIAIEGSVASTRFASTKEAYELLSTREKGYLAGLSAVHVNDLSPEGRSKPEAERVRLNEFDDVPPLATHPRTQHPVIKLHPRTRAPLLFLNQQMTSHIVGVDASRSEQLLSEGFEMLYSTGNIYEHQWNQGDLVVWDNITLQHARSAPAPGSRRTLRRVAISEHSITELMTEVGVPEYLVELKSASS